METATNGQTATAVAAESQPATETTSKAAADANTKLLEQAIAKTEIQCDETGALVPKSLEQFWRLAKYVHASGLAPKSFKSVEQVFVCFCYGAELGFKPMMSLQALAVVNGKVTIYGDVQFALAHPVLEYFREWYEDDKGLIDETAPGWMQRFAAAVKTQTLIACVEGKRKDSADIVREHFSLFEASGAGLTAKESPWKTYPARMLRWRPRGWALRRLAAEKFCGLVGAEEMEAGGGDVIVPSKAETRASGVADRLAMRATNLRDAALSDEPRIDANPITGEIAN